MIIKRHATLRDRGTKTILNQRPQITVVGSGLRLEFSSVVEARSTSAGTTSTYIVEVPREDFLRMIESLFDESVASTDDIYGC